LVFFFFLIYIKRSFFLKCLSQRHGVCLMGLSKLGSLGIYLQRFLLLISSLVIDVSRVPYHPIQKSANAAYRVKSHIYDGWIVYSLFIAALLLLVLRVPVLYGIQH